MKSSISSGREVEQRAAGLIADLMVVSGRTAPKAGGKDKIDIWLLDAEQRTRLGEAMVAYAEEAGDNKWARDGNGVLKSHALVLMAIKDAGTVGLDCGACGFPTCADKQRAEDVDRILKGPHCAHRLVDLGIAIGSAVKTASIHNVDNRIMYRVGAIARRVGLVDGDVVLGIPMHIGGKNIFVDR